MTAIARSIGGGLLAIWLIAGCATPAPSGPPASPRISCVGIPQEKCDAAIASVVRSLPNESPMAIDVTCVSGTCTADAGAMDTVVTLPDGRQLHADPLSWGGGGGGGPGVIGGSLAPIPQPALPVAPVCQGVPKSMCEQMAQGDFSDVANHGGVVTIVVSCSKAPCTETTGEGNTMVTFADGTSRTIGWSYQSSG